jgi:hypothetical protein
MRNSECGLQNCQFALGQAIEISRSRKVVEKPCGGNGPLIAQQIANRFLEKQS